MDRLRQFYIDGAWVDPVDGTAFEVIDPAHETVIETISLGGRADVDRAVAAARAAFPSWSLSTPAEIQKPKNTIFLHQNIFLISESYSEYVSMIETHRGGAFFGQSNRYFMRS